MTTVLRSLNEERIVLLTKRGGITGYLHANNEFEPPPFNIIRKSTQNVL